MKKNNDVLIASQQNYLINAKSSETPRESLENGTKASDTTALTKNGINTANNTRPQKIFPNKDNNVGTCISSWKGYNP